MKKIKVLKPYNDTGLGRMTTLGEIFEVSEERATEMVEAQKKTNEKYFEVLLEEKIEKAVVKEEKKEKAVKGKTAKRK